MESDSYFLVFFHGEATLDDAERQLRAWRFIITRNDDELSARRETGPEMVMGLNDEPYVLLEAEEYAEMHGLPGLASCERRFEVGFDDLEAVLFDTNTLVDVGAALQAVTKGYILYSWNGNIIVPSGFPCDCDQCP